MQLHFKVVYMLESLVELVRRMSVHDLSEDLSQHLDREKQSSNFENVIGAEGNRPVELQLNADIEDDALG